MSKGQSLIYRFYSKIDFDFHTECWNWIGAKVNGGYGCFSNSLAHRFSYELHVETVPRKILVCHNCPNGDNPSCVNPYHLWLGTQSDNLQDMLSKGRHYSYYKGISHCKYGHEFTKDNTMLVKPNLGNLHKRRVCRKCRAIRRKDTLND